MPLNDWVEPTTVNGQTAFEIAVTDTFSNAINEVGMGIFTVSVIAIAVAVLFMVIGLFGSGRSRTYDDGPPVVPPSGRITNLPNASSSDPIKGI